MQLPCFPDRCKCKYELRNLTVMKVVVILVIWVIGLLVIYMAFLSCLEPVLAREVLVCDHLSLKFANVFRKLNNKLLNTNLIDIVTK